MGVDPAGEEIDSPQLRERFFRIALHLLCRPVGGVLTHSVQDPTSRYRVAVLEFLTREKRLMFPHTEY